MLSNFIKRIRIGLWWNHLIAPLSAVLYAMLLLGSLPMKPYWWIDLIWLTISILGTAGLGYFLNDWTDIEVDRKAGKPNSASAVSFPVRWVILYMLLLVGAVPYVFLPFRWEIMLCWVGLIVTLFLYSVPPFRFKERAVAGLFCDAAYGHVLPVGITLSLAVVWFEPVVNQPVIIVLTLFLVLVLKGLRNILLHQIGDRHADRKAGLNTFVTVVGPLRSLNYINKVILPTEIAGNFLLLALLSVQIPLIILTLLIFLLLTIVLFRGWHLLKPPYRKLRFRYLYFMNDFYEAWLPFTLLAFVVGRYPESWWLLPVHAAVFFGALKTIYRDLRKLVRDFYIDLLGDIWKYIDRRVGYWINKDP